MQNAIEHQGLKNAVQGLITEKPLYASLLLQVEWIADPSCDTAWVDGIRAGFNPAYFDSLSIGEIKFIALHEVPGHIGHLHHVRRGDRDFDTWNEACDYVVNPIFLAEGYQMPEGLLYDRRFVGMDVEAVYDILWKEKQEQKQQDKGGEKDETGRPNQGDGEGTEGTGREDQSDAGEGGTGGGNDQRDGDGNKPGDSSSPPQGDQSGEGSGETSGNDQQSGAESGTAQGADTGRKAGRPGEVRDYPGETGNPSEADKDAEAQKWITILEQAANLHEKSCGSSIGYFRELIDSYRNPKVPWQEMLADWVTESIKSDYSLSRPNPRYNHTGFFLPSLHNVELGHFVFILDSSASVSNGEASCMMSEFRSILGTFRDATVTLLHVDTRVAYAETFESLEDIPDVLDVKGRGGTDFKPGFKWIEENLIEKGEEIAGVIYATDGECSSFPDEPDFPVIWMITRMPHMKYWTDPPFGDVAYYEE